MTSSYLELKNLIPSLIECQVPQTLPGHVGGDLPTYPGGDLQLLRDGWDKGRPRSLLRSAGGSAAGEMPHRGGWQRARARGAPGGSQNFLMVKHELKINTGMEVDIYIGMTIYSNVIFIKFIIIIIIILVLIVVVVVAIPIKPPRWCAKVPRSWRRPWPWPSPIAPPSARNATRCPRNDQSFFFCFPRKGGRVLRVCWVSKYELFLGLTYSKSLFFWS